ELVEVRAARRLLERVVVRDERDGVGPIGTLEHVEVRPVGRGILRDHRCFAMARRAGERRHERDRKKRRGGHDGHCTNACGKAHGCFIPPLVVGCSLLIAYATSTLSWTTQTDDERFSIRRSRAATVARGRPPTALSTARDAGIRVRSRFGSLRIAVRDADPGAARVRPPYERRPGPPVRRRNRDPNSPFCLPLDTGKLGSLT